MIGLLLLASMAGATLPTESTPVAADEVLVVPEGELDAMWRMSGKAEGLTPAQARKLHGGEACVTIGYVIEPDGTTSNPRVLRSLPAGTLDKDGIAAIAKWRFHAGPKNPDHLPVYSSGTFTVGTAAGKPAACFVEIKPADPQPITTGRG